MKLSGILLVASVISNIVQGWDCVAAGGTLFYVVQEFDLDSRLFFGWCVVTLVIDFMAIKFSWGRLSDWLGHRPLLIMASLIYLLHGCLMLWYHGVYMVLMARFVYGLELGLSFTLVSNYFLETKPHEALYILTPFLVFLCGAWLSCTMVFAMTLTELHKYWRFIFVVPSVLSLAFFLLIVVYVPETPKWLVSKGCIDEARLVLQQLRGTEDVSYELDLLVMSVGPVEVDSHSAVEEEADDEQNRTSPHGGQTIIITEADAPQVTTYSSTSSVHDENLPNQMEVSTIHQTDAPELVSIIVD